MNTEITITRQMASNAVVYCNAMIRAYGDKQAQAELAYNASTSDWNRDTYAARAERADEIKQGYEAALDIAHKMVAYFETDSTIVSANYSEDALFNAAPYIPRIMAEVK